MDFADGSQVGLVALAMLVTRSSVASLQAKQGLPLGTQVVGWVTLGKFLLSHYVFRVASRLCFSVLVSFVLQRPSSGLLGRLALLEDHNWTASLPGRPSWTIHLEVMAIFPQDASEAREMLAFFDHPLRAFHDRSRAAQVALAVFLAIYLPVIFLVALLWELAWREPSKFFRYRRRTFMPVDESCYWSVWTKSSVRQVPWLVLLQDEFVEALANGTGPESDGASMRTRRSSYFLRTIMSRAPEKLRRGHDPVLPRFCCPSWCSSRDGDVDMIVPGSQAS